METETEVPVNVGSAPATVLVVPCFNEEARLDAAAFRRCAEQVPGVSFVFVDDGSTDGTRHLIQALVDEDAGAFRLIVLPQNVGKAEAVRAGVVAAAATDPAFVGYWDADLSTPLEELPSFLEVMDDRPEVLVVLGSRVKLLGRDIRRRMVRHYVGRVFATATSVTLRLPVYDTQCGAKLFRCRPEVMAAFERPFRSRWIFDVEILARLTAIQRRRGGPDLTTVAHELPLERWHDVGGSKVGLGAYLRSGVDLVRIYFGELAGR